MSHLRCRQQPEGRQGEEGETEGAEGEGRGWSGEGCVQMDISVWAAVKVKDQCNNAYLKIFKNKVSFYSLQHILNTWHCSRDQRFNC